MNPDDGASKLGADLLLPIMRVTKDIRPLEWLAMKMGYALRPLSQTEPDRPTWEAEHVQDSMDMGHMATLMEQHASPDQVQMAAVKLYLFSSPLF